ncbi:MAG: serine hydrolase domain-containing protein [Trueperaceae bacterium]
MSLPKAESVLRSAIRDGVTVAAVAAAGRQAGSGGGPPESTLALGLCRENGPVTSTDTRFDLASLTKVVATLPSVLRLASNGELSLDDRIGRFFSNAGWFQSPSLADATIRELLTHTSGLPAWRPLFAEMDERHTAVAAVLQSRLEHPGRFVYSDLGFMLLGTLVERVAGVRLDRFARHEIFAPLSMDRTRFGPISGVPVAATEDCGWRGRLLEGEVHDENATVWDGVAGHAGLFGTAADLATYCRAWLELDSRLGSEALLVEATSEQARGDDGSRRGLGWMLASEGCFAGHGARGYGHTGFTGTSLWLESDAKAGAGGSFAVLLTNRVHPHRDRRTGIAELRIAFHEALRTGSDGPGGENGRDKHQRDDDTTSDAPRRAEPEGGKR